MSTLVTHENQRAVSPRNLTWPFYGWIGTSIFALLVGCDQKDAEPPATESASHIEQLTDLNEQIARSPNNLDLHFQRGQLYYQQRQYQFALADFERVLSIDPRHCKALDHRGRALRQLERFEEARDSYQKSLKICPGDSSTIAQLAYVLHLLGDSDAGLELTDSALLDDPESCALLNTRGLIFLELDRLDAALEHFERVNKIDPEYHLAWYNRGQVHRENGELNLALRYYNETLRLEPTYYFALVNRANVNETRGLTLLAIKDLSQAISLRPEESLAYANRGRRYAELARHDEALSDGDRAIQLNACADSYLARGKIHEQFGDTGAALRDYQKAVSLSPLDAMAHQALAATFFQIGQPEKALTAISKAIELDEKHPRFFVDRAAVYEELGDAPAALIDLNRAINLNDNDRLLRTQKPQFSRAHDNLAMLQRDAGDLNAALMNAKKATELTNSNASPYLTQGELYAMLGLSDKALESWHRALEIAPDSWDAQYNIGYTYSESQNLREAVAAFTKAIGLDASDSRAWQQRGVCRARLFNETKDVNMLKLAATDWREAVQLNPDDAFSRDNLKHVEAHLEQLAP